MACKNKTFESGFTIAKLEALEAAIAEGVLTVKYTDKEVTYRSLDDMLRTRDLMRRVLGLKAKCGGGLFGGKRIVGRHSKGLDDC
jgi:hypothetical protein